MFRPSQRVLSAGGCRRIGVDCDNVDEKLDGSVNGVRSSQAASPNSASFVRSQNPSAGKSMEDEDEMCVPSATNKKVCVQLVDQIVLAAVKRARQVELVVDMTPLVPVTATSDFSRRPGQYSKALRNMASQAPPVYDGNGRPEEVHNWLNKMETLFELIACPEQEKVEVASLYLMEDVSNWWDSAKPNIVVIPWTVFRIMLEDHYFPSDAPETKQEEHEPVTKKEKTRCRGTKRPAPSLPIEGTTTTASKASSGQIGNQILNRKGQPIVCYNCGKPGHLKPECEENLRTCRGCGRNGHMIRYCRGTNGGQARSQQASDVAPKPPNLGLNPVMDTGIVGRGVTL